MKKLAITMLTIGAMVANTNSKEQIPDFDQGIFEWSKTIAQVFDQVKRRYYQQVDPQKPIAKALRSFVNHLDRHSEFLDPESYNSIIETTQGEFFGIGIVIDNSKKPEDEHLIIKEVVPEGPADKAGLRANDQILQVDQATLKGLSVNEIIAKIKGKQNTTVHVKILRPGNTEIMSFDIVRDKVKEQNALCYYFKDYNIFYLALNMFTENSIKQLEALLQKCKTQHSKGLILDLRHNSGGLLNAVIDIAGMFLDKDSLVVVTKDREQKPIDRYTTTRTPLAIGDIPIIILIDNFTASAAEILAGCLQVHSEEGKQTTNKLSVFLVGTKSFGKGSVQEVIPLSNDCALKLTTALYYLPNDTCIQNIGIKPDFEIQPRFAATKDMQWVTDNFGRESALRNTIENPEKDKDAPAPEKKEKTWQEKRQDQIRNDFLVINSIRLIHMYNLANEAHPEKFKVRKNAVEFLRKEFLSDDVTLALEEIKI